MSPVVQDSQRQAGQHSIILIFQLYGSYHLTPVILAPGLIGLSILLMCSAAVSEMASVANSFTFLKHQSDV